MDSQTDAPLREGAAPPYYVSALLSTGAPHWGPNGTVLYDSQVGQAVTLTYGFARSAGETGADIAQFAPLGPQQQDAARRALAAWGAVANLSFVETPEAGSAAVRFATNRQNGQSAAYTYSPGPAPGGGVFLASDVSTNASPTPGSYGYLTLVHEIGHALGLKHPGDYDARTGGGEGPFLPPGEDNYAYSIMSYRRGAGLPPGWPTGPSIYDIAAIQHLYGPNMAAAPGDDAYVPDTLTYRAIWDPNGVNTLDARGHTVPVTLDLRPGALSTLNGLTSVGLAFGTRMQRAYGGSADDTLVPGGLGGLLDGGGGTNTAVFVGARSQYAIGATGGLAGSGNAYVVTGPDGAGTVLVNMQAARFGDGATETLSPAAGTFDALRYLASNPDVATAFGPDAAAATGHLLNHGVFEGRSLTRFDPARYLAANPDVRAVFGAGAAAATLHYLRYGLAEGRGIDGPAAAAPAAPVALQEDAFQGIEALQGERFDPIQAASMNDLAFLAGASVPGDVLMVEPVAAPAFAGESILRLGHRPAGDVLLAMAGLS